MNNEGAECSTGPSVGAEDLVVVDNAGYARPSPAPSDTHIDHFDSGITSQVRFTVSPLGPDFSAPCEIPSPDQPPLHRMPPLLRCQPPSDNDFRPSVSGPARHNEFGMRDPMPPT